MIALIEQLFTIGVLITCNLLAWKYITKRYVPKLLQEISNGVGDLLQEGLNSVGTDLAENIQKVLINPTVKRGYTLAGNLGHESRNLKTAENNISTAIIEKQIGEYKPLIQQFLGIDIDGAIEDYGAPAVLQLIQKFLPIIQNAMGGKSNKGTGALP